MTFALSEDQKHAAAIGLLVLPVLLLLWLGLELLLAHNAHHDGMAHLLAERAHDRALIKSAPVWNAQRETLRTLSARAPLFFETAQPATATARMQNDVVGAIASDHVTLLRNEVELEADNTRQRTELRMLLSFNADIATVTRVLFHLRQARPLLFVQAFELHALPKPAAAAPPPGPNILQAELTLVGVVQVP